jgi:hypothetical protein
MELTKENPKTNPRRKQSGPSWTDLLAFFHRLISGDEDVIAIWRCMDRRAQNDLLAPLELISTINGRREEFLQFRSFVKAI